MISQSFGGILRGVLAIANIPRPVQIGLLTVLILFGLLPVRFVHPADPEKGQAFPEKREASALGAEANRETENDSPISSVEATEDPADPPLVETATRPAGQNDSLGNVVRFTWDFGRESDPLADGWPDGWKRFVGTGYPQYIDVRIVPHDADLERQFRSLDAGVLKGWIALRQSYPGLPLLPPSVADAIVDRYLRIDLDGGQVRVQSPMVPASRMYKYRFSYRVMTNGLRHDRARAELVFLDKNNRELDSYFAPAVGKSTRWKRVTLDLVRPPDGAVRAMVRLHVQRGETGQEDIRGVIGFDDIRIEQYPQIQVATDRTTGLYQAGESIIATAKVMGLPAGASHVRFVLRDHDGKPVAEKVLRIELQHDLSEHQGLSSILSPATQKTPRKDREATNDNAADEQAMVDPSLEALSPAAKKRLAELGLLSGRGRNKNAAAISPAGVRLESDDDSSVAWELPALQPGFYRLSASLVGQTVSTLSTETTLAVIDRIIGGAPHGSFGWTLPSGLSGVTPREGADWLASLGVAWIKYPCWIDPADIQQAEFIASLVGKLQDYNIQTIGMLDLPPEDQYSLYSVRGRQDLVAAKLFSDLPTWKPLLEPIMSRLTLKVRTWQLGGDRDFSFMGRPRLRELITQISTGLQGFGQPIDVAICWPWLEQTLPPGENSWQAVCRSIDPPMVASELDAYLQLSESDPRGDGPRTWLLLNPVSREQYEREARIRDLVLRMAAVRSHRVQAAFVSDPYDADQGLLSKDGRPEELLLPWRTTSRLIGNLRRLGSLQLRSGAQNQVFSDANRAVVILWSANPTEELIYLGDEVQEVDVWGRVKNLPLETLGNQQVQRVKIGPVPKFIIGADSILLQFRMSVDVQPKKLDSFLGQRQQLSVSYANPTRQSLLGRLSIESPATWTIEAPQRGWEVLGGRSDKENFDVVLGSTAKIGEYELPLQFMFDTLPPQIITVYRKVDVGPEGVEFNVTTRLMPSGDLRVRIEITNNSDHDQSYDCMLFPPPGRQYQRRFVNIKPTETVQTTIYWTDGQELVGKRMLLRAGEQDGKRLLNYPIEVRE